MKTENRNNQVEKVFLRSAAVIISFVLISFTVSAQGFWKQLLTNNSFGKVAMLMVEESEASTTPAESNLPAETENATFYFEQAVDKTLELEGWMTDDAYFGAFINMAQPEVEQSLEIESWMTEDSYFNSRFSVDTEDELKLEAWMTNDKYWKM